MSPTEGEDKPVRAAISGLYEKFAPGLRAFLLGVLRDHHLAEEALQSTFAKVVLKGHTIEEADPRGWLFQVAYREAMYLRRRQGVETRGLQRLWPTDREHPPPDEQLIRDEDVRQVQESLKSLPPEQQQVVYGRVYRNQTFAEIAAELGVPLGTVLTRMRLALEKLHRNLAPPE